MGRFVDYRTAHAGAEAGVVDVVETKMNYARPGNRVATIVCTLRVRGRIIAFKRRLLDTFEFVVTESFHPSLSVATQAAKTTVILRLLADVSHRLLNIRFLLSGTVLAELDQAKGVDVVDGAVVDEHV